MYKMKRYVRCGLVLSLMICLLIALGTSVMADNTNTIDEIQSTEIRLDATEYDVEQSTETTLEKNIDGKGNAAVVTEEDGSVSWKFKVETTGKYYVKVGYHTVEGSSLQMERRVLIDGENRLGSTVTFGRSYSRNGNKTYDLQGNEIRSEESENICWQEESLKDNSGYAESDYYFELTAGEHRITFDSVLDRMAIGYVLFEPYEETVLSYVNVLQTGIKNGIKDADIKLKKYQAEEYFAKSDASILIQNDRTSAATEPSSADVIVYNTLGGSSWSSVGQWVEWEIEVAEDGWYQLGMRFRQNQKIGGMSSRILTIDGDVLFEECENVTFSYDNSWQSEYLGDEEAYRFYLTKGTHVIRLTVNLGEMADVLGKTNTLLEKLNKMYMQIIMVSGTSPDMKRDYNFKAQIPDVIEQYHETAMEISTLIKEIDELTDGNQSTVELEDVKDLLERLYKDPETTAKRLSDFSSNVSSLASWLSDSRSQPLEVDYLYVNKPEGGLPKSSANFFENIVFQVKQLIASYRMDYSSVGNTNPDSNKDEALHVWVIAGTEQAQVIQKLINEKFTAKTSISVQLQNVTQNALMPAIFAGRGPDVVLNLDEATPVNYALRGVVMDLNQFDDIAEVLEQYSNCSYESFQYDGSLYALPTTVDYPVLFYRKDVVEELGISLEDCETWEKILQVVLPKLQTKNLKFGLTPSLNSFLMFYYQGENELYSENNRSILLDSKESVNAFTMYSSIYTDYKQDMSFNFVNLFRSGEMPFAVMPYSQYYQLAVFAPEIGEKWGIMVVPGTENENGNVNHSAACTVTGASILSATEQEDEAWEFLKWWSGDEIQEEYAREIETLLGIAGRVNPSSLKARDSISWTKDVKKILNEQLGYCHGVPQVAGSYYVSRYFDFAFRDVVYDGDDIVQTLISVTEDINTEIEEKTQELQNGT